MVAPVQRRAAVSLVERSGRLLCVWNRRYRGWSLPGGMVEDGESVEDAQRRELAEEAGLETLERQLVFEGEHDLVSQPDRASYVYVFRVQTAGRPQAVEDGCPIHWMTPDEFLTHSPFRAFYARVFAALYAHAPEEDPKRLHHPEGCEGKSPNAKLCSVECRTWALSVFESESRASFAAARYLNGGCKEADFEVLEKALDEANLLHGNYPNARPEVTPPLAPMTDDPLDDAPPEVRERIVSASRARAATRALPPVVEGEMPIFRLAQTWAREHAPSLSDEALRVLASQIANQCLKGGA